MVAIAKSYKYLLATMPAQALIIDDRFCFKR